MKAVKIITISLLVYVGLVAVFESMLGVFQPASQTTLVITTVDADGTRHDRVLARFPSGGQLYVSANHWPRAWYRRALDNPNVEVEVDGVRGPYLAVPVSGEEAERVRSDHPFGIMFRFMTGFPVRRFARLDPR